MTEFEQRILDGWLSTQAMNESPASNPICQETELRPFHLASRAYHAPSENNGAAVNLNSR
ncbi:MAG: hypothetical protein H6834_14575 [Planctomycetes bacterium]|nr:hypothetical protein [Planctomycetota bacterium]